jgi:opacity protein-like surface antigen
MHKFAPLALAIAATTAAPAVAQEFYFGGGLAYSSGTSDNVTGGGGESDLSAGMLTLLVGQRFAAGSGFWGWETSADLSFGAETENTDNGFPCSDGAEGSYLCSQDATLRLVGIYGMPVGQGTELFGSLGVGMMTGDFADSSSSVESASTYGLTVGAGVNVAVGNELTARGEVIYDSFTNTTQDEYSSDYKGTTFRLVLVRKF